MTGYKPEKMTKIRSKKKTVFDISIGCQHIGMSFNSIMMRALNKGKHRSNSQQTIFH
jgi:hypothetical protein